LKAIVLSGGPGTRLRPLTCSRPKLLIPVSNQPIIDRIIQKLSESGISEVVLAVNYMADALKHHLGETKFGLNIKYSVEPKPLGTGGPIKYAERLLNLKAGEILLILNGDIITDINYRELVETHLKFAERLHTILTIALHEVKDPRRYGLAQLDSSGKIVRFIEKPKGLKSGGYINAGIYAADSRLFSYLKADKCSIEREVFPVLAEEGRLCGLKQKGLWVDVGKPKEYMDANFKILDINGGVGVANSATVDPTARIIAPSLVGENVRIASKAKVGPYAILGNGVNVGEGCKIQHTIIFNGSTFGKRSTINRSVLGSFSTVGSRVKIGRGCIIGDYTVLGNNVKLSRNVSICPYKQVEKNYLKPGWIN
jgi:NDP-sugar pyrophosphorylase family protein